MSAPESNGSPGHGPAVASEQRPDPVFVLCMGRSGSTLLRFLLDAHPTWDAVLNGQLNLHALRHNELRYCPAGDDSPIVSQARIEMLADLFGLGKRVPTVAAQQEPARRDMAAGS